MNIKLKIASVCLSWLVFATSMLAQNSKQLEGRWDLTVSKDGKELPSWLEIRHSGNKTLVGRFVYATGSARPVAQIKLTGEKFSFAIPPQWEEGDTDLEFEGQLVGDHLKGTVLDTDGKTYRWVASRAPLLNTTKIPIWGAPMKLFNDKDLSGWHATGTNQWVVEDGILKSKQSGSNLVSDKTFTDFKLHIEFRYPKNGNSGVYLRGRYEVQIADNKGSEPNDILFGGVYGFLTANQMVAKETGEWQAMDITLVGRKVTVVANGVTIISEQLIPGITGGALDSKEGEPGPIMLQGDHEPIEFRNIVVTPVME